jgi:glycosyltransferase involved in cell wall biosynthesis
MGSPSPHAARILSDPRMTERQPTRTWLLVGAALSGYTFDLFRVIRSRFGIETRFVHAPLDGTGAFAHETFADSSFSEIRWNGASVRSLASFARAARPEAVLLYGTQARKAIAVALATAPREAPVVFASDANISALAQERAIAAKKLAYTWLFRRIDAAFSLGYTNATAFRLLGAKRIVDVPVYAVDYEALDRSAAEGADDAPLPSSPKLTLMTVARLVPVKNHAALIEAVGGDPDLTQRCRLAFVGDGPERASLEERAKRYPDLDVHFLGSIPRTRIGRVMCKADALVLPSTAEPWGIVTCEALGLGVPVVASPAVGAAMSLAGQTQGIAVARSPRAEDLRETLGLVTREARRMKESARATASEIRRHYDVRHVADRMVEAMSDLARLKTIGLYRE